MDSIANYIKDENDILYRRGEIKGMEKGIEKGMKKGIEKGIEIGMEKGMEKLKESFVKNLLLNTDFTIAKIARLTNATEAFIKKVKKTLK